MLEKKEIHKKQMSNKKINIFQFTLSSMPDVMMHHTLRKPQENFLPRTPNPFLSPAVPLENPQSDTHRSKGPQPPHRKTQRQTLAPTFKKRGPVKENLSHA
jgi:hypothetical protein